MKQFDMQMVLVDGKPEVHVVFTVWGTLVAAWKSRTMLKGWRRLIWPVLVPLIFLLGLTRRKQVIPMLPPGEL
jgi:hypothetical protein